MIARVWRGAVRGEDADAYADYMRRTGVSDYAATDGNRGVWMLRRKDGESAEFVMFTLWDSIDAVRAFAGADYVQAVFYPDDDAYLVERDLEARHYEVVHPVGDVESAPLLNPRILGQAEAAHGALLTRLLESAKLSFHAWVGLNLIDAGSRDAGAGSVLENLCSAMKIEPAEAQQVLDGLRDAGLTREASDGLFLTEHGADVFADVRDRVDRMVEELYADIPRQDLEVAARVLGALTARANAKLAVAAR
jgi:heme-degrading monooxygenase HmoA